MTVNARANLVTRKILGKDSLVDKILQEPESPEAELFAQARRINSNYLKRQYLEASLLASADLDKISELLEMPLPVIVMYRDMFYNVLGLDKLSKMELLQLPDKGEGLLKMWALTQGLPFIEWRLGGKIVVSPIEGLQDLFTTCIYKSKEAMFNPNTSEASKESTKYIKLAMDLARLLKVWVMDSAAAKKDIELALMEVVPEFKGLDSLEKALEDDHKKMEKELNKQSSNENDNGVAEVDGMSEIGSFSLDDLMKSNNDE
jgi:hypothetical protein